MRPTPPPVSLDPAPSDATKKRLDARWAYVPGSMHKNPVYAKRELDCTIDALRSAASASLSRFDGKGGATAISHLGD